MPKQKKFPPPLPTGAERFSRLSETFDITVASMRDIISKLPAEHRILLAGKVETIDRTHQALMDEFACKPKS